MHTYTHAQLKKKSTNASDTPQTAKSRIITKTLEPTWHEHFCFRLPDYSLRREEADEVDAGSGSENVRSSGTWLRVEVFDYDAVSRDDSLGFVSIKIEDVFPELHRCA